MVFLIYLQQLIAWFEAAILECLTTWMEAADVGSHRVPVFMACKINLLS